MGPRAIYCSRAAPDRIATHTSKVTTPGAKNGAVAIATKIGIRITR